MDTGIPPDQLAQTGAMQTRLDAQKAAFLAEMPISLDIRRDRLSRAIALLVDHQDRLVEALDADYQGRPVLMSKFTDIASSIKSLKDARSHLNSWTKPEKRSVELSVRLLGGKAWIEYQPKGVIGVMSPWNFPVNLTFGPLAGILAAGNRAMIKPSEHTPETSDLMAELIASAFDPDEISVFTGGPAVGQAFSALPFDHLIFTGATAIGRHVMRAAADNLVPVTLELGGKSPAVVGRSADLERTAERLVAGKMLNAGQVCLAPDYVLVPADKEKALIGALTSAAQRIYGGQEAQTASIIHDRHAGRLRGYVEDAQSQGAMVYELVALNDPERPNLLGLTVLTHVTDQMAVMQEEIFGPILPILTYETMDEAIGIITSRDHPLGLYYFGEDATEQRQLLDRTRAGGVTINDTIFHISQEALPFGGVGPSGMGYYHGQAGFKEFSHAKAVYQQTPRPLLKMIGALPPYGRRLRTVLKTQIKK